MIICIDPGHGGKSRANVGSTGYVEADGVLDIAKLLRPMLAPHYDIRMTRDADKTVELYDRAKMANDWKADLFISIHTNAGSATARGAETYYSFKGEWGTIFQAEAKRVAAIVQAEMVAATGMVDRGIKTSLVNNPGSSIHGMDYYGVIRRSKCPALIVEAGFHSTPADEALLKTSRFRQKIAEGIAAGVMKAYPVKKQESDPRLTAIDLLTQEGIISSPEYWRLNSETGRMVKGEFVASLIIKMAEKLRR